jgi:hypothetical protein
MQRDSADGIDYQSLSDNDYNRWVARYVTDALWECTRFREPWFRNPGFRNQLESHVFDLFTRFGRAIVIGGGLCRKLGASPEFAGIFICLSLAKLRLEERGEPVGGVSGLFSRNSNMPPFTIEDEKLLSLFKVYAAEAGDLYKNFHTQFCAQLAAEAEANARDAQKKLQVVVPPQRAQAG